MSLPISIVEKTDFVNLVVRVVIEHEGKFLCVQEGKEYVRGLWAFPGGKVDVGEVLTEAAKREILEETGVEIELIGLVGINHTLWDNRPGFSLQINFLAKATRIPEQFPLSEEVLAVEWKSLEEIETLLADGKLRNKAQGVMVEMLKVGKILPLELLRETSAPSPVGVFTK